MAVPLHTLSGLIPHYTGMLHLLLHWVARPPLILTQLTTLLRCCSNLQTIRYVVRSYDCRNTSSCHEP